MARISIPTTARLPSSLRIDPANPAVLKVLNRLSRPSLLALALDWLDENNDVLCAPYLRPEAEEDESEDEDDDPDDFYPPARSPGSLRETYVELQSRKGSKREVVDRIVECDWRHGLTLYQLAMADLQHLYDHPLSQKWSAYRIAPLGPLSSKNVDADEPPKADKESLVVPRFHPSTFLQKLQSLVPPDIKAHYNLDRPKDYPLLLLRIFILDSPYNTELATATATSGSGERSAASFDTSRTVYVAFPDASPYVYISKSTQVAASGSASAPAIGEAKSLRSLVVKGIPKALSKPQSRYTLQPTGLSTRNLAELLHRRGAGRTNSAGGGWSIYADERKRQSPLDTVLPTPPLSEVGDGGQDSQASKAGGARKRGILSSPDTAREERVAKRARAIAQARFGDSAKMDDGRGVERVDIIMEDPFPETPESSGNGTADGGADESDSPWTNRRKSRGGRRSGVDMELDLTAELDDDATGEQQVEGDWRPRIRLTFHGPHVFAGVRQLVEHGIIDGERMPGWMTGEEGVTIGAVRHGRIRGHKGSGV